MRMRWIRHAGGTLAVLLWTMSAAPGASDITAADLVQGILRSDPWGLGDAHVVARATIREKSGGLRQLVFETKSRRYDGLLAKSVLRVTAPADLAGMAFLQIQTESGDDDRWLYLPELRRSRRVAGRTRQSAFMGTDFSYADLDRRDLRDADARLAGSASLDQVPCWRVDVSPRAADAVYGRLEIWIRKDNGVPIQWQMFARSGTLVKTLVASEVRRIEDRWFIVRSVMTNLADGRETLLTLDRIVPTHTLPDDEFTVRALERS